MTTSQKERIREFFNSIRIDNLDINDYIKESDYEDINLYRPFDSIRDMIEENDGFNVDIIYYDSAMDYLKRNDSSLKESLELASQLGFSIENLNSETLASIHASECVKNEFYALENEIEEFFSELLEEIENEEEEEE